VSGRRAPHIPVTDPPDYEKSDEDFIAKLRELKGTPEELLDNDELLRFMLPVLRADFELAQTYQYYEEFPLSCPITAFGATDDEESQDGRLDGWRIHSTKRFGRHILDGDHFFLHSAQDRLLTILGMELSRVVRFRT
jgi:medium-chain acyl-[acyl-carrier-protein] hydrolase